VDSIRFDRLSRVVGEQTDRRGMLKVAAGSALALTGLGAFVGGALADQGYKGDDCSNNPDVCKSGLRCNDDFKCEYKHKCGGQRRGKPGDACKKRKDCCQKGTKQTCNNKKCKRDN
jgi:hypothetical protein